MCRIGCLVWLVLISTHSFANELSVLTSEYPPYVKFNDEGMTGFSVDVFDEVQKRLGWTYKVAKEPWARVYTKVTTQPNVMLLFMSRTAPREELVKWSRAYSSDTVHLYALKSRTDIDINTIEELSQYSVVTYRNGAPTEFLQKMGFVAEMLVEVNTPRQLVEMLKLGRVDLAADFDKGFVYNSLHYNADKVISQPITQIINYQIPVGFALSKDSNPTVLRQINSTLLDMEKDGTLTTLREKWFYYMD